MNGQESLDIAVVGGGVVGLGTAWAAAKRGARVAVFESNSYAQSASIRNFGMIWPIGQPAGDRYQLARANCRLWQELAKSAGFGLDPCGSLHLAHHSDEWDTLQEFAQEYCDTTLPAELLTAEETLARTPAANPDGLLGSLFSPVECRVDPREAIDAAARWLSDSGQVEFHYGAHVTDVHDGGLVTADGVEHAASLVVVCSGAEFARLLPRQHAESGLLRCKLQMLRTIHQGEGWRLGPHLASGLTLRHYDSFQNCPSQARVIARYAETSPELDQVGIHVMLSQARDGQVVLGDSHEYGDAISPFDRSDIEAWMMRELRRVFRLPTWEVEQRWSGVYAKLKDRPFLVDWADGFENVAIINGFGGAGMSLSLAVTDEFMETLLSQTA